MSSYARTYNINYIHYTYNRIKVHYNTHTHHRLHIKAHRT